MSTKTEPTMTREEAEKYADMQALSHFMVPMGNNSSAAAYCALLLAKDYPEYVERLLAAFHTTFMEITNDEDEADDQLAEGRRFVRKFVKQWAKVLEDPFEVAEETKARSAEGRELRENDPSAFEQKVIEKALQAAFPGAHVHVVDRSELSERNPIELPATMPRDEKKGLVN